MKSFPLVLQGLDKCQEVKAENADEMKMSLNQFLEYFEKTNVGCQGRTGWLNGKFPITIWNNHSNMLEIRQILTNRHEGFHILSQFFLIFHFNVVNNLWFTDALMTLTCV
jgi:hypothetical protein